MAAGFRLTSVAFLIELLFYGKRVYYPHLLLGCGMPFSFPNLAPALIRRWSCNFINTYKYKERKILYEKRNYCKCNSE